MAKNKKKKRSKHRKQHSANRASSMDDILERWKSGMESSNSIELWGDTIEAIQEASGDQLKNFMRLWLAVIIDTPVEREGLNSILRKTSESWPTDKANELHKLLGDFRMYLQCAIMNEDQDLQRRQSLMDMDPAVIAVLIARASA